MRGGIFIPKDLKKFTEESFDHIISDIETFKKTLIGFNRAFNSNKNLIVTNKTEFPMLNVNQFLHMNSPNHNKSFSMNATNPNFNKNSKLNNEDLFFFTVFQILLGEQFETLIKTYDHNIFKNLNEMNDEIVTKMKEHNTMTVHALFRNIES